MRAANWMFWLLTALILFLCSYVYAGYFGTPWEKSRQKGEMQSYLTKKYQDDFSIEKTKYNPLSETYQAYAYPNNHAHLLFLVQVDHDSKSGYSDTYPKVVWGTDLSVEMKRKMKDLFPDLDESSFKAMQILERGESYSPNIPTISPLHASPRSCFITINVKAKWNQQDPIREHKKLAELNEYLQSIHFPVLVEVRYFEREISQHSKVFFITEDGKIIDS